MLVITYLISFLGIITLLTNLRCINLNFNPTDKISEDLRLYLPFFKPVEFMIIGLKLLIQLVLLIN